LAFEHRPADGPVRPCDEQQNLVTPSVLEELIGEADENGSKKRSELGDELAGKCFQGVDLSGMTLSYLNLKGSILTGAVLEGANLSHCNLADTNLERARLFRAILTDSDLSNADLCGADLKSADLSRAKLFGAQLRNADFKGCVLNQTLLRHDTMGQRILQDRANEHMEARTIYLELKENFHNTGVYDGASWAYVRERIMERKSFAPTSARQYYGSEEHLGESGPLRGVPLQTIIRFYLKYTLKWFWACMQELMWGYGQRPLRVWGSAAVIIIVFAFVYRFLGGISNPDPKRSLDIVDYLIYSLFAFTTSSLATLTPVTRLVQVLTSIEGILGVSSLALFTTALAQRMGGR